MLDDDNAFRFDASNAENVQERQKSGDTEKARLYALMCKYILIVANKALSRLMLTNKMKIADAWLTQVSYVAKASDYGLRTCMGRVISLSE